MSDIESTLFSIIPKELLISSLSKVVKCCSIEAFIDFWSYSISTKSPLRQLMSSEFSVEFNAFSIEDLISFCLLSIVNKIFFNSFISAETSVFSEFFTTESRVDLISFCSLLRLNRISFNSLISSEFSVDFISSSRLFILSSRTDLSS